MNMHSETVNGNPAPFSYAYYRHMLDQCRKAGFTVTSFERFNERITRTIILRHDVDYTLDGLLEFAEIEADLGCSATYLFRVHADEYNLYSPVSVATIRALEDMGHEIGLHFEAMNVGSRASARSRKPSQGGEGSDRDHSWKSYPLVFRAP
jgi:hypothetical protein